MLQQILPLAVIVGVLAGLVVIAWLTRRSYKACMRRTDAALASLLAEASTPAFDGEPHVRIVFHLYDGFLVFFRQRRLEVSVAASAAEPLIDELVRLNLRNLRRYPGAFYVPPLTLLEAWRQRRSIRRQAAAAGATSAQVRSA